MPIVLFFYSLITNADAPFGNEWINANQKYYSIPVANDGVYQVNGQFLIDNGIDVSSFTSSEIQLWYRGKEISILVEDAGDNSFDSADRFLFYGRKNDGQIDSTLYLDPSLQANQYYNLFSDTSKYFLTWSSGVLGKRMNTISAPLTNVSDLTVHEAEYIKPIIEDYSFGNEPISYIYNSQYDFGEGWFSNVITKGRSRTVDVSGINPISSTFQLEIQLVGRNNLEHDIEVSVGSQKFNVTGFTGAEFKTVKQSFSTSLISGGQLSVSISPQGVGGNADAISLAYIKLIVPEGFNNNSKTYNYWNVSGSAGDGISITKSTQIKYLFDISTEENLQNHLLKKENDLTSFQLDKSKKTTFLSVSELAILTPNYAKEVFFENDDSEVEYIILTHPVFYAGAEEYAQYRSSAEGGGYSTKVISVNRLYDQYGYGAFSPYSIRNYFRYLDNLKHTPKYLLLIGNGSAVSLKQSGRPYYRFINFDGTDANGVERYGNVNYMPTMGNPGSDILYTSGLFGSDREPGIPTGRIGVKNEGQIHIYLGKVKQHDKLSYDLAWRKRALHLSGGEANEAPYFLARMNQLSNKFKTPLIGGTVETLTKKTDKEVEFFNLSKYVNEGISFLSFIGHSSPSVIEIDIGEVNDDSWGYNNPNKYPVLYLNGCQTGDVYNNNSRLENWLFSTEERGAIAALGHTSYGYSSELFKNADDFYRLAFNDTTWYKESLGHIHKQMVADFDEGPNVNNIREESFWPQFAYYGDPAVHLFSPLYAEYIPLANTGNVTSLNGEPLTINSDSIYVGFTLANYGKTVSDSVEICIKRIYNGGAAEQILDPIKIPSVYYEEEVFIAIENPKNVKGGLNEFEISVNCNQGVNEYNFENNTLKFSHVFKSDAHFNLVPYNYSIEGNPEVNFAYHSYNLSNQFSYEFQLDTSRFFTNPLANRIDQGHVVNFQLDLPIQKDSTIFFWRTRIVNNAEVDTSWRVSSFTYISNKSGWGQFDATQLSGNSIEGITYNKKANSISFNEVQNVVKVRAPGNQVPDYNQETEISVNGQGIVIRGGINSCTRDGIYVLAFDKTSGLPYHTSGNYNGSCGVRPRIALDFNNLANQGQRNSLLNYMNSIPEDAYVLVSSAGSSTLNNVTGDQALLDMFHEFGASLIDAVENNKGYIFLGQRGGEALFEGIAQTEEEVLSEEIVISGKQYKSQIVTDKIGPVISWDSLVVNMTEDEDLNYFTASNFYTEEGNSSYSYANREYNYSYNLSDLNEDSVNTILFYSQIIDSVNFNYPKNHDWAVFYEPVPEGVLIKTSLGSNQLGFYENYKADFEFINVGKKPFKDSLLVVVQILNANSEELYSDTVKIKAPEVNTKELFQINKSVLELIGENNISITVNPGIEKELNYTNNYWEGSFSVYGDQLNPILSVTFDGKQIKNEDVISANSSIEIIGTDLWEGINSISDSSAQILLLKLCDETGCPDTVYTDTDFLFTEDSLSPKWNLETTFTEGKYKLLTKVSDNSKNSTEEYAVVFNVVKQLKFQFLPVYPNPAFDAVYFEADLLGGNEYPEELKIEIYNLSGIKLSTFNKDNFQRVNFGERGVSLKMNIQSPILTSGIYFYTFKAVFQDATYNSSGKLFIIK